MRERRMLRIHQHREKLQIVAERRTGREPTQPCRAPRKHELAIGQTDAGYRRLSESFDLTRFEDSLRHGASLEDIHPSSPQPRQRSSAFAQALFGLDALADLAEPRAMVLPRPTGRNHAARHGADRSLDPDSGIDVNDDGEDQHEREKGMRQSGESNHADGKKPREIHSPAHGTRY